MSQSEPELEQILIDRLMGLVYEPVKISNAKVGYSPIKTVFKDFWNKERVEAIQPLCQSGNLKMEAVNQMIADYKFSGK